ncbi:hypothetical protein [Psychrobacillus psychrodurans]|uniref:hypothetical protein n=1 Tax=Psychrobacillus psychrodurans TaxID=126157 RepID=UPI0008E7128A|nr:hypothetical protein [Psychrobacillus psychrodurans]MCZ8540279.1 hypothetical protein [Psychrobacillus psychrodurans]SFM61452.1 hypothetical protein SAMN05421832_104157 [Psychrobacillus psychrodurans]
MYTLKQDEALLNLYQLNVSKNGQFIVQRKIFSDIYPDFPDSIIFKVYIYLCKAVDWKYRKVKTAKSVIRRDLSLSRTKLENALIWLESNFFIKRTNTNTKQMYQAKILTAPDYDPINKLFVSCEDISTHTSSFKKRNQGYIMIPSDAITNEMLENKASSNRKWTKSKITVLLMLYAHCWLEYFGGVNPEVVKLDMNGNVIGIKPSFYFTLVKNEKNIVKIIEELMKLQMVKTVPVYFYNGVYFGDQAMTTFRQGYENHVVLRPFHLSSKKVNKPLMDFKRAAMIL